MKDLKHYFSTPTNSPSPKTSVETVIVENEMGSSSVTDKKKKKKRKRKLSDCEVNLFESEVAVVTPTDKRKRRKSLEVIVPANVEKLNFRSNETDLPNGLSPEDTPKGEKRTKNKSSISKKSKDNGSSKENSTVGSDNDEKVCATPDNGKSLFNYFNKVDKLPEIDVKPRRIKVEVVVHADMSGSPPPPITNGKLPLRKTRKSRKKSEVDFDLITQEIIPEPDITYQPLGDNPKRNSPNPDVDDAKPGKETVSKACTVGASKAELKLSSKTPKISLGSSNEKEIVLENIGDERKTVNVNKVSSDGVSNSKSKCISSIDLTEESPEKEIVVIDGEDEVKSVNVTEVSSDRVPNPQSNGISSIDLTNEPVHLSDALPIEKPKVKLSGTLDSFFNRGKTPAVSAAKSLAKQQFLASGVPSCVKKISTTLSCEGKEAPFPSKSHICQKDRTNALWCLPQVRFNFNPPLESPIEVPKWSPLSCVGEENFTGEKDKKPASFNGKAALKELKKELNLFPIGCWQKELKKMRKGTEATMWTERYRPRVSSGFLANTRNIMKLKTWLTDLMEANNRDDGLSSGDEFMKGDDDDDKVEKKTLVLLTGPPGSGKTAAVYAVAEEIGYNVLEINASSNRSGKKILNEFSEAMQSHKVGTTKLNFSKAKKKKEEPNRNLILVEDADLLFEDDEGFVPTLMNLGASTKRPIILVANNQHAKHFAKLSNLFHSTLSFLPPTVDRLGSWLRTVSAVEGFNLSQQDSMKLASTQDIRKALLQLQLSQTCSKASQQNVKEEISIWEKTCDLDFSNVEDRKQAKDILSALSTLDVIRNEKSGIDIPYWKKPLEDSTLSNECRSSPSQDLDDIEAALLGLISYNSPTNSHEFYFEVPRNLIDVEKDVWNMTNMLNRRSTCLDYWPTLRQISRNETARLTSHTKRNNRYFNYLSSLGVKGPPDFINSLASPFSNKSKPPDQV